MPRLKTGLSIGVMVALAIAIWAALASGDSDPEPTTTTTTTTLATSTTTAPTTTTSTTTPPQTSVPDTTVNAEARREEVRLILEDLYFGWFDAIYHNDEEAVREVVATSNNIEDFHQAVESLTLPSPPIRAEIQVKDVEILRDDDRCLVTYSILDVSQWRGEGALSEGVNVLLPVEGEWRFGTAWTHRYDLWEADCSIEPDLP